MKTALILDEQELAVYHLIKKQFSGLTIEQALNAVSAATGFLEALEDQTDETFIFN